MQDGLKDIPTGTIEKAIAKTINDLAGTNYVCQITKLEFDDDEGQVAMSISFKEDYCNGDPTPVLPKEVYNRIYKEGYEAGKKPGKQECWTVPIGANPKPRHMTSVSTLGAKLNRRRTIANEMRLWRASTLRCSLKSPKVSQDSFCGDELKKAADSFQSSAAFCAG